MPRRRLRPRGDVGADRNQVFRCEIRDDEFHQLRLRTVAGALLDRLALQVDRLNQGMKHRRVMDEAPMQLAERWCRTGPVVEDDSEVRERFFRACRIALE